MSNSTFKYAFLFSALLALLTACNGDDGNNGLPGSNGMDGMGGADGSNGSNGGSTRITQTRLAPGNSECMDGGLMITSTVTPGDVSLTPTSETSYLCSPTSLNTNKNFVRIANFPICSQIEANCNDDTETIAEIVVASPDGMTLYYSDSETEALGIVDITNPSNPQPRFTIPLSGEPTSIATKGNYTLVAVNTSADFINVGGELVVYNIGASDTVPSTALRTIDLGGQPDSAAVSPDGNYIAVVIENERDEDLGDGVPPQAPAGELIIVNASDADPANWSASTVTLTGITDLYAGDPEPEYVDINEDNIAVVTLQENNHIVLVDLATGTVTNDFTAGSVDLTQIDATEEDLAIISQTESQDGVPREPDGVAWVNANYFATADEGDLDGGSRGFTIFDMEGNVVWNSGNTLDHLAVRFGHYPDGRSGNKGNEPENVEVGTFGNERYLFVNSERSNLVFVYDIADPRNPVYKQTLPASVGPEGGVAIPSRNLYVVASEKDDRGGKYRSVLNIYQYNTAPSVYPSIQSGDRINGSPIPWSALSGLVADPQMSDVLYSVEDSFYGSNRIFKIDTSVSPALLNEEITISDSNDVLSTALTAWAADASDPTTVVSDEFDTNDIAALINSDKSVNIDPEGVAVANDNGFWIVSEGSGTVGDASRPVVSLNMLIKTDMYGVITAAYTLPAAQNNVQLRFGFEGVTEYNGNVYVAFQRVWPGDTEVRIGVFNIAGESWSYFFYPLDTPASQNGGWVGLSDITALGDGEFIVIERDNQGSYDAVIKRIYHFDITGLITGASVTKTLITDLIPHLDAKNGQRLEKIEGLAVKNSGDVLIVNDNDGVDDNNGEVQLINLGDILP